MNFDSGIHLLKESGLNIFLSEKVSSLPENIFNFSKEQKNKMLCLIGHGGKKLWENIPDHNIENPIDNFSLKKMHEFASVSLDGDIEILFPDDRFILPLQKLSRVFNFSTQSPLGMDISRDYGLWFAVRGVFLTKAKIPLLSAPLQGFPCDDCHTKPCLKAATIDEGRLVCPIKIEHQYSPEQLKYHHKALKNLKN